MDETFAKKSYVDIEGAKLLAEKLVDFNTRMQTGYYCIDFIEGSQYQEYNCNKDIIITKVVTSNIKLPIALVVNSEVVDVIENIHVQTGDLLSWEANKDNPELPASIGVYYKYQS